MKLSEAIRKGSELRPMIRGTYFGWLDGQICSCVLGAALEAATGAGIKTLDRPLLLAKTWPVLLKGWEWSPDDNEPPRLIDLNEIVVTMNDSGKFTREQIADWLESIGL